MVNRSHNGNRPSHAAVLGSGMAGLTAAAVLAAALHLVASPPLLFHPATMMRVLAGAFTGEE